MCNEKGARHSQPGLEAVAKLVPPKQKQGGNAEEGEEGRRQAHRSSCSLRSILTCADCCKRRSSFLILSASPEKNLGRKRGRRCGRKTGNGVRQGRAALGEEAGGALEKASKAPVEGPKCKLLVVVREFRLSAKRVCAKRRQEKVSVLMGRLSDHPQSMLLT